MVLITVKLRKHNNRKTDNIYDSLEMEYHINVPPKSPLPPKNLFFSYSVFTGFTLICFEKSMKIDANYNKTQI